MISDVITFLIQNPNPTEQSVGSFANSISSSPTEVNNTMYKLATITANFMRGGKSGEAHTDVNSVDSGELAAGIQIEYEHTKDLCMAKKIALDHLTEFKLYYSYLKSMEETMQEDQ